MKNLRIYIHGNNMFSMSAVRSLVRESKSFNIFTYHLEVEKLQTLPTESNICETNQTRYPDNLKAKTLAINMKTLEGCVTPYVKNQEVTCTKEDAMRALLSVRSFAVENVYTPPCNILRTKLHLESMTQKSYEEKTFIINLPSAILRTRSKYSYSFISFIADAGNWLGLLTGICLLQVFLLRF